MWLASWQWLTMPLSGSAEHHLAPAIYWHARLMVLAWGVCLPVGALVARYFKVTPGQDWPRVLDNPLWWHAHRALQYTGALATFVGLWLIWRSGAVLPSAKPAVWAHHLLGWTVVSLCALQIVSGLFRGSKGGPTQARLAGDHFDMSPWRVAFEYIHKSAGWCAIALGLLVIGLGLWLADAPRWMPLVLAAWWTLLLGLGLHWQRRGCCLDTYQAIWGVDPRMPGLQRPPIGWGVRRTRRQPWHFSSGQF